MRYETVVAGGLLVTGPGVLRGYLGINAGRIARIGEAPLIGDDMVDARDRTVLPGAVDLHVHFNDPGRTDWEGWGPGSRAAAAGGVTTVAEMPLNCLPPVTTVDALQAKVAAAQGQSMVDYALWGGLITDNREHLASLAAAGVIGFKALMSHSSTEEFTHVEDGVLFDGLQRLRDLDQFLAVHAESNAITQDRMRRLQADGRRDRMAWGEARPPVAELEAIHRALFLAQQAGCRLHIVHMSLPEGAEMIHAARSRGQAVTVETCGHYLALTDDDFVRLGPVAKCAPPLRDRARQLGLWEAVLGGRIDCITSDHSPCPIEDKARGNDDVWAAWGGITGIQTLVPLMLTEGVLERGLSLERFTALMSTNPAKIAGLWPRKGEIRIGADADLLLVDLQRAWRVAPAWPYSLPPPPPFLCPPIKTWVATALFWGRAIVLAGGV